MWIFLAVLSALLLGVYDIFKKLSVNGNNVLTVLLYNTFFGALIMSPIVVMGIIGDASVLGGDATGHLRILGKSAIVLSAWIMGYFGIKRLPLTITGPISATRPLMVLVGAMLVFGEQLNLLQWIGVLLGVVSLFFINRVGAREGVSFKSASLILCLGSAVMGAVSGLYDKYLLRLYEPMQVQAWYSLYQFVIMGVTIFIIKRAVPAAGKTPFEFRWTIPCIALFLTLADLAYFYALSQPSSLISVVSMTRRCSIIVPFFFGIFALKEKNARLKTVDLLILLTALGFLVAGSR